jgi:hypothetical protein
MTTSRKVIEILEIGEAPIKPGQITGPMLLIPNGDGACTIGRHDGDKWIDDLTETEISPEYWAELPTLPEITGS